MPVADKMVEMIDKSSMIRKMFEEGAKLKAQHGPENVYDFSLGNPDVPPPAEFNKVLKDLVNDDNLNHGYTPSPGLPEVRKAVADFVSSEHGVNLPLEMVIMTVGAAGALNNIFKALINPGDEILTPSPYFVGYNQYSFIAGAPLKTVATDPNFNLDPAAIEAAITENTRVMLSIPRTTPPGPYTRPTS